MKKEEIPQDLGALGKITGEIVYAVDESGKYTTELSNGWEVKSIRTGCGLERCGAANCSSQGKSDSQGSQPDIVFYGTASDGYSDRSGLYRFLEMAGEKTSETSGIRKTFFDKNLADMQQYLKCRWKN